MSACYAGKKAGEKVVGVLRSDMAQGEVAGERSKLREGKWLYGCKGRCKRCTTSAIW